MRGCYEAMLTGDAAALARLRPQLDALSVRTSELPRERLLAQAWLGEQVQLLVLQAPPAGYRIDPRHAIARLQPDDQSPVRR